MSTFLFQTAVVKAQVVTEHNASAHMAKWAGMPRGLRPRKEAYGKRANTITFEDAGLKVIPRDEWPDRIREMEEGKKSLVHLVREQNIPPLNQANTNYCWANGPTQAVQIRRVTSGHPLVLLSPASVASIIKKGRNEGGWGTQAMELMADRGINSTKLWGPNDRNYRTLDTEEARDEAKRFRVKKWLEAEPRNMDQEFTLYFLGFATGNGHNRWSHEITGLRPVYSGGDAKALKNYGRDIYNSWGPNYGDGGIGTLMGPGWVADDIVVPWEIEESDN